VYREHVGAVFAFLAYSVDRHVAEDLTANAFERVVRHWGRYDAARASERTWILSIARNTLIDHYRRQSHRNATSLDAHPLLMDSLVEQDDPLARSMADDAFVDRLSGLKPREREVLALRFGADLSGTEIAAVMDLTEANVHQIISRSLKRLRAAAEEAGEISGSD
jgi:RNA polymerase sigma-70 factor (ECF subfamily)